LLTYGLEEKLEYHILRPAAHEEDAGKGNKDDKGGEGSAVLAARLVAACGQHDQAAGAPERPKDGGGEPLQHGVSSHRSSVLSKSAMIEAVLQAHKAELMGHLMLAVQEAMHKFVHPPSSADPAHHEGSSVEFLHTQPVPKRPCMEAGPEDAPSPPTSAATTACTCASQQAAHTPVASSAKDDSTKPDYVGMVRGCLLCD
jgi:hypothetical protein